MALDRYGPLGRGLLLAAAIAMGALGAAPASALEQLKIGKPSTNHNFLFGLIDVGAKAGIFPRHGLDVSVIAFGGAPKMMQAMAAGSIDMAISSGPDLALVVRGAPMKGVAAVARAPDLGLAVRPDGDIKTVADLKDRHVSASGTGSITGWLPTELARQQGWGTDGVHITVATGTTSWALLKTKQIDGVNTDMGTIFLMEKLGQGKLLVRYSDIVPDFPMYIFFASNQTMQARPDTVRAFLKGWYETVAWVKTHRDEAIRLSKEVVGLDEDILGRLYDSQMDLYLDDGHFKPHAMETLGKAYVDMKLLDRVPDMSTLYTEAFLPPERTKTQ
jgi:ABC-type nitrate/sulfonate/bicarbonate transport system substrate-binding protein